MSRADGCITHAAGVGCTLERSAGIQVFFHRVDLNIQLPVCHGTLNEKEKRRRDTGINGEYLDLKRSKFKSGHWLIS